MAKFRKRPLVVEAEQWFPDRPVEGVTYPVQEAGVGHVPFRELHGKDCGAIKTLEGWHVVSPGDWVIIGAKGEKYPCKPDVFAMTYERVEP